MRRGAILSREFPALYWAWHSCHRRCNETESPGYQYYGGRGITVCKRWESLAAFAADMGPHPGKGWSLDRIDNNKGYSKANCRWATSTTQNRNSRAATLSPVQVAGIRAQYIRGTGRHNRGTSVLLALQYGVSQGTINRIARGKSWK